MPSVSLGRLLFIGLIAAFIASTIGTALLFLDAAWDHPVRWLLGDRRRYDLHSSIEVSGLVWMISLGGTLPGCLIIGVPAIYPFRNIIARHPLISLLPTIIYAVAFALLLFGWTLTPTADGVRDYEVLWFFSAGSAVGFVSALGYWASEQWEPGS